MESGETTPGTGAASPFVALSGTTNSDGSYRGHMIQTRQIRQVGKTKAIYHAWLRVIAALPLLCLPLLV